MKTAKVHRVDDYFSIVICPNCNGMSTKTTGGIYNGKVLMRTENDDGTISKVSEFKCLKCQENCRVEIMVNKFDERIR